MPIALPLVALDVLVLALWCIAAALAIALIMRKIGDVFSHIPVIGGYLAGAVNAIAQVITNAAGSLEHGVDKLVGAAWHLLARYMDHLWNHLVASSGLVAGMAEELAREAHALARLKSLVHKAVGVVGDVVPRVKSLEREYTHLRHRLKAVEDQLARGIGHDLRIRIKALEREYTGLRDRVIPDLRAGVKAAEGEVTDLRNFIKAVPGTKYLDWVAAIGIAALASLGLDFLKCDNAKNMSKTRGCSTWGALDDLLGLVALGIAAENFDALVHEAQALTGAATTVFDDVFGLSR